VDVPPSSALLLLSESSSTMSNSNGDDSLENSLLLNNEYSNVIIPLEMKPIPPHVHMTDQYWSPTVNTVAESIVMQEVLTPSISRIVGNGLENDISSSLENSTENIEALDLDEHEQLKLAFSTFQLDSSSDSQSPPASKRQAVAIGGPQALKDFSLASLANAIAEDKRRALLAANEEAKIQAEQSQIQPSSQQHSVDVENESLSLEPLV